MPVAAVPSAHAVQAASPGSGCVVLDGASTSADVTAPVTAAAQLAQTPTDTAYLATLGYHVERTSYPRSAAVAWRLRLVAQHLPSCPTQVVLRVYPLFGETVGSAPAAVRYVDATAGESTVDTLVADLPADATTSSSGPCLGLDIVLLDRSGAVVQAAPSRGPIVTCPGVSQDYTFAG